MWKNPWVLGLSWWMRERSKHGIRGKSSLSKTEDKWSSDYLFVFLCPLPPPTQQQTQDDEFLPDQVWFSFLQISAEYAWKLKTLDLLGFECNFSQQSSAIFIPYYNFFHFCFLLFSTKCLTSQMKMVCRFALYKMYFLDFDFYFSFLLSCPLDKCPAVRLPDQPSPPDKWGRCNNPGKRDGKYFVD